MFEIGLMKKGEPFLITELYGQTSLLCTEDDKLTIEEERHHQIRHQAPLGIMHVIPIPQPGLRLSSNLSFFAFGILFRSQSRCEMLNEVLRNEARLGEYNGF